MSAIAYANNKVIAGQYQGGTVASVLSRVSISGGGLASPLLLSKDTVEACEIITEERLKRTDPGDELGLLNHALLASVAPQDGVAPGKGGNVHYLALQFKGGEKSLLEVDRGLCAVIVKSCLSGAPPYCGVKPENIKACDPFDQGVCSGCSCHGCVLWPKCCFARLRTRRQSSKGLN